VSPRPRIVAEKSRSREVSELLWRGLIRYNRTQAGPLRYTRTVLSVRDANGKIAGGLILENYWKESYVELLWVSSKMRGRDLGTRLILEAEKRARRRGSKLLHLNTFSFQAPRFYEKLGFRRFGALHGSPEGASRYFYVKRI
jgi:GNAT superfamily N-acetyltransferase